MKIGFISDDYHPRVDGVVVYIDAMSLALERLGHKVYIICPRYPDYEESEGNVVRVSSYDPLPFSKLTSRMVVTNKKTLAQIKDLELDVIHVHTQAGANFAAYKAARQTGVKLLTTVHTTYHPLIGVYPWVAFVAVIMGNFLSFRYYRDFRALRSLARLPFPLKKTIASWADSYIKSVLDHSDIVVTNSTHTKKYVQSFASSTEIKIVRNGIDRNLFKPRGKKEPSDGAFKFVLTSRVSGEKRQEIALRAVAELVKDGYDCHLTLVGGGSNRRNCERLVDELSIRDNVAITGEVEREVVIKELAKADVGIFTSYHFDTDPLAVMEYLSMGLPVIYCDENFDHMFVDGSAIKCAKDYKAFAGEMAKVMSDTKKLNEMSKFAIESSKLHDIFDRAKELEQLYKNAQRTKSD